MKNNNKVKELSTHLNFYLKMLPGETEEEAIQRTEKLLEQVANSSNSSYQIYNQEINEF